jgi:hypothetical protein
MDSTRKNTKFSGFSFAAAARSSAPAGNKAASAPPSMVFKNLRRLVFSLIVQCHDYNTQFSHVVQLRQFVLS